LDKVFITLYPFIHGDHAASFQIKQKHVKVKPNGARLQMLFLHD